MAATGEVHVQLAVNFASNRKIRSLRRYGREARAVRDLYVQMLCHCKAMMTDGFVAADEIALLVYPDPEKVGMRDAARLTEAGLIEAAEGGYRVTGYLQRNPSKAAVLDKAERKAAGARMANHLRWHVEQGTSDPRCQLCQTSDQTSDRSTDDTSDQSPESERVGTDSGTDSTETESKTETKSKTVASDAARGYELGSDDDPDFCAFWDAYPRKIGKATARERWKKCVGKKHHEPKDIILGAERFRDECRRKRTETDYIPHPSTWLNGERYNDNPADGESGESRRTAAWEN